MNYNWKFEIPADRPKSNPYVKSYKVTFGCITHVTISNPAGSVGKSHLQIFFHEFQIYPLNKGFWYEGEKINVAFRDSFYLYATPYILKFKGYNESMTYAHAFYINITILREDVLEEGGVVSVLKGYKGEV